MQKNRPKSLNVLWEDFKSYLDNRLELMKLTVLKKGSKLAADLVTNTLVLFCLLMAFLGSAITLAFYLSHLLGSYSRGFGCAALFFTLLALLISWKKNAFERFIAGLAIRRYFEKHCEEVMED